MSDNFDDIIKGLSFETEETLDFTQWDSPKLIERLQEIDSTLLEAGTLLSTGDRHDRDLQSERAAIVFVLKGRGL